MKRFADLKGSPNSRLHFDAAFFDELDKGSSASIHNGRLTGIHFDQGIVDSHAGKRGEQMFHGMNFDVPFRDGGCALDRFDMVNDRINRRFIGQINPLEFDSMISWSRLKRNRYLTARVQ
jgi:hypothetical protein